MGTKFEKNTLRILFILGINFFVKKLYCFDFRQFTCQKRLS
jgi:hypothetical protein